MMSPSVGAEIYLHTPLNILSFLKQGDIDTHSDRYVQSISELWQASTHPLSLTRSNFERSMSQTDRKHSVEHESELQPQWQRQRQRQQQRQRRQHTQCLNNIYFSPPSASNKLRVWGARYACLPQNRPIPAQILDRQGGISERAHTRRGAPESSAGVCSCRPKPPRCSCRAGHLSDMQACQRVTEVRASKHEKASTCTADGFMALSNSWCHGYHQVHHWSTLLLQPSTLQISYWGTLFVGCALTSGGAPCWAEAVAPKPPQRRAPVVLGRLTEVMAGCRY